MLWHEALSAHPKAPSIFLRVPPAHPQALINDSVLCTCLPAVLLQLGLLPGQAAGDIMQGSYRRFYPHSGDGAASSVLLLSQSCG